MILYDRAGNELVANYRDTKGKLFRVRDRKCWRCGGLGGAEKWRHTGWTCHRCGGSGNDPVKERVPLYTAEQNARLDAAQAKRDEKKAAARAEAARVEQERRDAEREEIISDNAEFLARIDAELAHGDHEILQSVRDRIAEQAKEPTDRQIEVVNQIIERNTAERARRAVAAHVGEIGKRSVMTLKLLYTRSQIIGKFPTIWSHWSLFTDENGCKIACKSAPWTIGLEKTYPEGRSQDGYYEKGQTVTVKATVIEHTTDKDGEPLTYVNRPKKVEA